MQDGRKCCVALESSDLNGFSAQMHGSLSGLLGYRM
jgi:hypothetical protein